MTNLPDIAWLVLAAIAAVTIPFVLRARKRDHETNLTQLAQDHVCPHLKPALDTLLSRGHHVRRVGQKLPEMPMEIHLSPPFDPAALQSELHLADPVFLSPERQVLFCKEHWCELHPKP